MRLNAGGMLCFLLSEHANDASSDFVMNDCFVVFADDVDAKFLIEKVSMRVRGDRRGGSREEGMGAKDDTYNDVTSLEFEWIRFRAFSAEPLTIYEGTV